VNTELTNVQRMVHEWMTWQMFDKRLEERLSAKIRSAAKDLLRMKDCERKDAFSSFANPYIQWRE